MTSQKEALKRLQFKANTQILEQFSFPGTGRQHVTTRKMNQWKMCILKHFVLIIIINICI